MKIYDELLEFTPSSNSFDIERNWIICVKMTWQLHFTKTNLVWPLEQAFERCQVSPFKEQSVEIFSEGNKLSLQKKKHLTPPLQFNVGISTFNIVVASVKNITADTRLCLPVHRQASPFNGVEVTSVVISLSLLHDTF